MYAVSTFKGAELDLKHFQGGTIRAYEIELLNDDCTAMDIDIYADIQLNVRYKQGGTIVNSYSLLAGDITKTDNFIYWTAELADFEGIPRLEYFHECLGVLSNGQKDLLFKGISDLS